MGQTSEHADISLKILRELLVYRRNLKHQTAPLREKEEAQVTSVQLPRIHAFVKDARQIEFILPAFPTKSPNANKVLGTLPDMAERLSLIFLNALCQRIQLYYPPGARIIICSDGHVFGDLIQVEDAVIDAYQQGIQDLIHESGATRLALFKLEDVETFARHKGDYPRLRQLLLAEYSEPEAQVKQQLTESEAGLQLYRAISRFLYEDGQTPEYHGSHTELQRAAKQRAVGVIRHSRAWGRLLEQYFPDAIRLSIHPQPATGLKFGLHMMPTKDDWLTPWHGVAANIDGTFVLIKRKRALDMQGELVCIRGVPSYYLIPSAPQAGFNPAMPMHPPIPISHGRTYTNPMNAF